MDRYKSYTGDFAGRFATDYKTVTLWTDVSGIDKYGKRCREVGHVEADQVTRFTVRNKARNLHDAVQVARSRMLCKGDGFNNFSAHGGIEQVNSSRFRILLEISTAAAVRIQLVQGIGGVALVEGKYTLKAGAGVAVQSTVIPSETPEFVIQVGGHFRRHERIGIHSADRTTIAVGDDVILIARVPDEAAALRIEGRVNWKSGVRAENGHARPTGEQRVVEWGRSSREVAGRARIIRLDQTGVIGQLVLDRTAGAGPTIAYHELTGVGVVRKAHASTEADSKEWFVNNVISPASG